MLCGSVRSPLRCNRRRIAEDAHGNLPCRPTATCGGLQRSRMAGLRAGEGHLRCALRRRRQDVRPAVKVAGALTLLLGMRSEPRISAHGDHGTVTAIAADLVAFHSTEGGHSGSEPVKVNDVPTSECEGLHDLASGPDGRTFLTWLDLPTGRRKCSGRNRPMPAAVGEKASQSISHPTNPTASAAIRLRSSMRRAILRSRGVIPSQVRCDMWMRTRASSAKVFTPAVKLGEGIWRLNACPRTADGLWRSATENWQCLATRRRIVFRSARRCGGLAREPA